MLGIKYLEPAKYSFMSLSLSTLLNLMRVRQYVKNLFIFMPLFFVGGILNSPQLFAAFWAFIAFSLASSAVYIFNDLGDIRQDQQHPLKKYRPLAANLISSQMAIYIMLIILLFATALMFFISISALKVMAAYLLINIFYSLWLKTIAVLDVLLIATGFVLRLYTGSVVTNVPLSIWIVVMTFLLALFIALAKRRDDVLLSVQKGRAMRTAIVGYNLKFLDAALIVTAAITIVAYFLYTISPEVTARLSVNYLYVSTLFVISGILRYLKLTFIDHKSGSPIQLLFKDPLMQVIIVMWLLFYIWVIY
jgi:4-hydroxybenzoate polyprenyltransferase